LGVILGGLDHLLADVESDLPPLIDEPDAEWLVRHRDPAVLVGEREAVRDAGLLEQALGLGPGLGCRARSRPASRAPPAPWRRACPAPARQPALSQSRSWTAPAP